MRIAMIGHKYVPSREGGVEIVVEELASRMAKDNDVTLFNRKRNQYKKIKEYKGCKIKNVFTINKKALDAIIYAFFATIRGVFGKYDVLHFHAEGPCFFLWMTKFCKKKVVVTIHGLDWQRGKWGGFASKILKKGEERAVKHADEIIVLSKNVQNYFKSEYNRETTFIPNGVSEPKLLEVNMIKEKYNLNKNSYILFLARIVPEKGLDYLIDAWTQMNELEKGGKKLVIAGGDSHSGDYYSSIVKKCENDNTIVMTGFVTDDLLCELYSNAYLYVLPSDLEGMPMSLLEALSYGNRCLVSDIPENKDVISSKDYTFKKGNVNSLKENLITLIDNDIETHVGSYIPYKWEDVANATVEIYKKRK